MKEVPLSKNIISGNPKRDIRFLNTLMVSNEDVEATSNASNHLECASTTTSMVFPSKGPR